MKLAHHGLIKEGKFKAEDPANFQKELAHYEGKEVSLSMGPRRKPRSMEQNSYYWGVIVSLLADYLGYTLDEMHEALRAKFLCVDPTVKLPKYRSTAQLSTSDAEDYYRRVREWAAIELSFYIPLPNEVANPF